MVFPEWSVLAGPPNGWPSKIWHRYRQTVRFLRLHPGERSLHVDAVPKRERRVAYVRVKTRRRREEGGRSHQSDEDPVEHRGRNRRRERCTALVGGSA